MKEEAVKKIGDQNFKTAIALIELHRVRYDAYPESLDDLRFMGVLDSLALEAVEYRKLAEGYELNVAKGWQARVPPAYPEEFWQGLGIAKSNMRADADS
jgi:hypothetical protein